MQRAYSIKKISVKEQTIYALTAIAAAVVFPQLFHLVGKVFGIGTALGELLLPMHLPIMLIGFIAGPYAGALAGFMSPLVSFALTAMPSPVLLPFMMIELGVYGLAAGLMRSTKIPTIGKVFITQLLGRIIRAIAIVIAVYLLKVSPINISIIRASIIQGLLGIVLQLVLIPIIIKS